MTRSDEDLYLEWRRWLAVRTIEAPNEVIDPYGACPLDQYIDGDPPRLYMSRARVDGAKAHWEAAVRASDAKCREVGIEPLGWDRPECQPDWAWCYAHCLPEPRPVVPQRTKRPREAASLPLGPPRTIAEAQAQAAALWSPIPIEFDAEETLPNTLGKVGESCSSWPSETEITH